MTSASMFGFKLSTLELIKYSMDLQSTLDQERAALVSELEMVSLSDDDRRRVSVVLNHHPIPDLWMGNKPPAHASPARLVHDDEMTDLVPVVPIQNP